MFAIIVALLVTIIALRYIDTLKSNKQGNTIDKIDKKIYKRSKKDGEA